MRFSIYVSLKHRNYIKYVIQCSYHQARKAKGLPRGIVQSQEKEEPSHSEVLLLDCMDSLMHEQFSKVIWCKNHGTLFIYLVSNLLTPFPNLQKLQVLLYSGAGDRVSPLPSLHNTEFCLFNMDGPFLLLVSATATWQC